MHAVAGMLRLHLGSGSTLVPGWENLDKSWNVHLSRLPRLRRLLAQARILTEEQASAVLPRGTIRADIRRGLDYPDGSAAYVYASHLIEHMSRWQGLRLLRECLRVLEPGGVIRLATPDLALAVAEYAAGEAPYGPTAADSFMQQLETHREIEGTRAQQVIRKFVFAPHQWLYDEESLALLLTEAGFDDPRRCEYRSGAVPDLEQLEHRPGSLFMEATRP